MAMVEQIPSAAGVQPRHTIEVTSKGILHVRIHGVWNAAEVDRFFAALAPIHADVRQHWSCVLTLIEVAAVQSPPVALHVRNRALAIKRPGDRNALVVATFLSKLQIKRLGSNDGFGVFTDVATAEDWLLQP